MILCRDHPENEKHIPSSATPLWLWAYLLDRKWRKSNYGRSSVGHRQQMPATIKWTEGDERSKNIPGAKWQWYWITDKCCIWYSDTVENKVLFWCILCYRCLFLLAMIQFKEELPWHYHLALINHDPNDDDDYEPLSFRLPIIPVNGGWLWHYQLA